MKKILFFLFLAGWLLAGCASSTAGAAVHATSPVKASPTATIQPQVSTALSFAPTALPFAPTTLPLALLNVSVATPLPGTPLATPSPLSHTPSRNITQTVAPAVPVEPSLPSSTPAARPTPMPEAWKTWPAVPPLSQTAKEIYQTGLAMGRDPHRFSKVGDCQNITTYFLSHFENPDLYHLGDYADLKPAIDWYMGSYARESLAVKGGMNVAAVLSPLRANPELCNEGESPLTCEYRLYNPSFAIISMEEAWDGEPEKYGKYMRQVIEATLEQNILPVIATKADNLEGGDQINAIIAELAWEYDIPLWNFWAAVQPLHHQGLDEDGFHLTHGNNFFFDVPESQRTGYTLRNLTALQLIDAIWKSASDQ